MRKKRGRRQVSDFVQQAVFHRALAESSHDACYAACLEETEELLRKNPELEKRIQQVARDFFLAMAEGFFASGRKR